jgi:prevent-host-death family protein
MALTVNVHEAKTRLSDLLARAEAGEEILIARANKPVARLVPIVARPRQRALGLNAGWVVSIAADFDAALGSDWLAVPLEPPPPPQSRRGR